MYGIGDTILYGGNGVCRVEDIVKRTFNGDTVDYYVLQPLYSDRSLIYVPIQNKNLTDRIRRVISREEIDRLICDAAQEDAPWIENEQERKETYRHILSTGDPQKTLQMIRSLYRYQQEQKQRGKKLRQADERLLREAEKLLCDEWATVLQMSPDQVPEFIAEHMKTVA